MSSKTKTRFQKLKRNLQTIALISMIVFGIAPVLLAAIPGTSSNTSFSIYNTGYDGLSEVRTELLSETTSNGDQKYNVTNIVSNLNALNRFNGSGALAIVGPSSDFGVTETISVILYLLRGGSLIVADDFGTSNQLLEPIFQAFQNLNKFAAQAEKQGFPMPNIDEILSGFSGESDGSDTGGDTGNDTGSQLPGGGLGGGSGASAGVSEGDFITNLLGDLIVRFGINSSGILMDTRNNIDNPAQAVIKDFNTEQIGGYTFTQGLDSVAMEFGSIITVQLNVTDDATNESKLVWQPLQKLSGAQLGDQFGSGSFNLSLPFFPMYSSKFSWIETNFEQAAEGTMEPNEGEWGNAQFATALSIPLFPGMGKLVFLSDASIFINRYTQDPNYDNLQLVKNLMDMATAHQNVTDGKKIPIIFDFGHTYQGPLSPALYSTVLLKLISEMSMFPLYAPFIPFFAYGYGRKIIPKTRRLRPVLLTKRRGEKGHSDFERKLELIKETGTYGEPIMHLSRKLVRIVQKDSRFEGNFAKDPKEMSSFFAEHYPYNIGSQRELASQLSTIFKIASNPTRRMNKVAAKKYLNLLDKLITLIEG